MNLQIVTQILAAIKIGTLQACQFVSDDQINISPSIGLKTSLRWNNRFHHIYDSYSIPPSGSGPCVVKAVYCCVATAGAIMHAVTARAITALHSKQPVHMLQGDL